MTYRAGLIGFLVLAAFGSTYAYHARVGSGIFEIAEDETEGESHDGHEEVAALAQALATPAASYSVSSSTPQFVILAFDGSKSVEMMGETLDFEQKLQAEGKPLKFTYFINAAYFLTQNSASLYQAPGEPRGTTKIGFSNSAQDIAQRVAAFNKAFSLGNEIGSHTVGHFDGSRWSSSDWKQEFTSFQTLMAGVQQNNSSVHIDAPQFLASMHGFRAPNLGYNAQLYQALADFRFAYDASQVGAPTAWPHKDSFGVWHIPLGTIFLDANKTPAVAMDYSLWVHQSGAKNIAKKDTPLWNSYFLSVKNAYENYFDKNYTGTRAPVVIGNHFSKWNDGVYWEAMKAFAEEECGKPHVHCTTYDELVSYLNTEGVPAKNTHS